jgi:hypothetical protein
MVLAANHVYYARTKYIELDYHFVWEKLANKQLAINFLCSADQIADFLTKSLPKSRCLQLCNKLTMLNNPLSLKGRMEGNVMDNYNIDKTG